MNDPRIDQILRGAVPEDDSFARGRARDRLRVAIEREEVRIRERAPRRRRWPWLTAAALTIVAVTLVQFGVPSGPGGSPNAAAEIRRLGDISASQPSIEFGPSEVLYRYYEETRLESQMDVTTGATYNTLAHVAVESWLSKDGSGLLKTTYLEDVGLASASDEQVWKDAGSPPLSKTGDVDRAPYEAGGLPVYPVDRLPTDPDALRMKLNDGSVIRHGDGGSNLLSAIGTVLGQQDLPPDLRQAMFDVAAAIPDIVVLHDVQDPTGRIAIGLELTDDVGRTELFFDPATAKFLGQSEDFGSGQGSTVIIEWRAYIRIGVVSHIGDTPSATGG